MNPELKAQWLTALRSGKYKQATSYLHTQDGYCCLGVACDIFAPLVQGHWANEDGRLQADFYCKTPEGAVDSGDLVLPQLLADKMGMVTNSNHPTMAVRDLIRACPEHKARIEACYSERNGNEYLDIPLCLTPLNDNGFTFEEIADIIERFY